MMMLTYRLLLRVVFFMMFSFSLNAQRQTVIDSLQRALQKTQADTTRLKIYNQLAYQLLPDSTQVMAYTQKAIALAKTTNVTMELVEAYVLRGRLLYRLGHSDLASKYYRQILTIPNIENYPKAKADYFMGLTLIEGAKSNYEQALLYGNRALKIYKSSNHQARCQEALYQLGVIHSKEGSYDIAISQYFEALKIAKALRDTQGQTEIYNNIGLLYNWKGANPKALEYLFQALSLGEKQGKAGLLGRAYDNIGVVY